MKYHCEPEGVHVVMGIVDDTELEASVMKPCAHIFLGEKAKWWDAADSVGVPRHEGFGPAFRDMLRAWYAEGCPRRADVGNE